ncbi:MAG: hypothetical protein ACLTS6_11685 [Anaerobutyricum sp.]
MALHKVTVTMLAQLVRTTGSTPKACEEKDVTGSQIWRVTGRYEPD